MRHSAGPIAAVAEGRAIASGAERVKSLKRLDQIPAHTVWVVNGVSAQTMHLSTTRNQGERSPSALYPDKNGLGLG